MHRRQFLSRVGASVPVALAGCFSEDEQPPPSSMRPPVDGPADSPPPTQEPSTGAERLAQYDERFDSVVNVGDLDVSPDGRQSILPVLREHAADNTLLYFPEGRYLMPTDWHFSDFRNFGIVGDGATIVPPEGYAGYLFAIGGPGRATGFLFEGFTFDFTAHNTGARPMQAIVDDQLTVRDVAVRGVQDTVQDMMRFDVTAPDGFGVVERMRLPDGGAPRTPTTGCLVGPSSVGTITFRDCHISRFPDNGLYASPAKGPVRVLGGTYTNNGIANVRVSGDSLVRGVHVRCDEARPGVENMRGIRLRQGAHARVENCVVEMEKVTFSDGGITVAPWLDSATIVNTKITVDADNVPAIKLKSPTSPGTSRSPQVTCRGVSIDGTAARNVAVQLADRDDCVFDGVCIRQTGANRDGILAIRSHGTTISDTDIAVTGDPIVLEDSTIETTDVTTIGSNPGIVGGCDPL